MEHVFRLIQIAIFDVCTRFVHTRFDIVLIQRCLFCFVGQRIFFLIYVVPNRIVAECKKIYSRYQCVVYDIILESTGINTVNELD